MKTSTMRHLALTVFGSLLLINTGCFLQTISGATFQAGSSLITTVETDSILATCVQGGSTGGNVECTYFFRDENGVPVDVTSSATLISEFGILGVVIDPLIYQIPDDAFNITGTYDDGNGNAGDLVVLSGYRSIPIDIRRILFAEPGTQFVIAELPDGVPFEDIQFNFSLSFTQGPFAALPVSVKPMLAMKYQTPDGSQVFYPPFLPCEHDMPSVPSITIQQDVALQPIQLSAGNFSGCNQEFYELLGFGVFACDFDADNDVDADDIALLASVRNSPALPGDRLDANGDGFIDLNDARRCARQCLSPQCGIANTGTQPIRDKIVAPVIPGMRP